MNEILLKVALNTITFYPHKGIKKTSVDRYMSSLMQIVCVKYVSENNLIQYIMQLKLNKTDISMNIHMYSPSSMCGSNTCKVNLDYTIIKKLT